VAVDGLTIPFPSLRVVNLGHELEVKEREGVFVSLIGEMRGLGSHHLLGRRPAPVIFLFSPVRAPPKSKAIVLSLYW
jgi:hypothetical protein